MVARDAENRKKMGKGNVSMNALSGFSDNEDGDCGRSRAVITLLHQNRHMILDYWRVKGQCQSEEVFSYSFLHCTNTKICIPNLAEF